MSPKRLLFIFLAALISLIFLTTRLYNFENRFAFDHDQEQAANAAYRIIVEKTPMLIGQEASIGGLFTGPFLFWFQALFMYFGNLNPLALGYLAVLISFLTIIILFLAVSEISNIWQALLVAFLYATSTQLMTYDISANAYTYITFYAVILFWLLIKIFTKHKYYLFPVLALISSLAFHIHFALILLIPVSIILFFLEKPKLKKSQILLSIFFFLLPFTTFLLFDLRHDFLITSKLLNFTRSESGFSFSGVLETTKTLMSSTLESVLPKNNYFGALFLSVIAIFIVIMEKTKNEKVLQIMLLMIFLPLFLLWFYSGPIPPYYFLPSVPIVIVAISFVCFFIIKKTKFLFLIIVIAMGLFQIASFKTHTNSPIPFSLKNSIVNAVIDDAGGESFNLYYQIPYAFNTGYRYLFKWKGKEPQEGAELLYIIEQADSSQFSLEKYHKSFPQKKVSAQSFNGFLHVISVK